jgi:hypothetical protein
MKGGKIDGKGEKVAKEGHMLAYVIYFLYLCSAKYGESIKII